jgi:hypothetical protein
MSADLSWAIAAGVALLLLALCLFDARLLNDGDTYWHVAAGDWMLKHTQVPHIDTFSFSRSGARWQAHEWLAEVAMAAAFALGSWNGVVVLYGAALAATALVLSAELRRFLAPASLTVALVLVFTCIMPSLLARPHILALPMATGWTVALLRARDENRAPSWWASGLMLVWANLHGSFVFGFVLLAFFAFEACWESPRDARWSTLRGWLLFCALSIAMAMATPEGPAGLIFPFQLMHMSSLAGIDEWRAMDFSGLNLRDRARGDAVHLSDARRDHFRAARASASPAPAHGTSAQQTCRHRRAARGPDIGGADRQSAEASKARCSRRVCERVARFGRGRTHYRRGPHDRTGDAYGRPDNAFSGTRSRTGRAANQSRAQSI